MKFGNLSAYLLLASTVLAIYPPPEGISNDNKDLISITSNTINKPNESINKEPQYTDETSLETLSSPFYSFYLSISMIIVSEIGDKTFLIAAIMAMRHPQMIVFSAASSALVLMTVLSGLIGQLLPQILSPKLTRSAASILFLIFGINLLREGLSTSKDQGVEDELAEVEEEIANVELNEISNDLEKANENIIKHTWTSRIKNLISYISSPIWFQTFSMTFLGEWGDRSQVTTIAMAAGANWFSIIIGGSIGHILCTLLAVLGGQYISTRISLRTILLGGSFAFFIFSILYGYSALYES